MFFGPDQKFEAYGEKPFHSENVKSLYEEDMMIFSKIKNINSEDDDKRDIQDFLKGLEKKIEIVVEEKEKRVLKKGIDKMQQKIQKVFEKFDAFLKDWKKYKKKHRSKPFDQEIYKVISEISKLHSNLVEKLPDNLKERHMKFDLSALLTNFYEKLTFPTIELFSSLLSFEKLILIDFITILEEHEDLRQELEGYINSFDLNMDTEITSLKKQLVE
jgi:Asp-tRNA(Asn)/Glu-tRNA(Gln) amidotransferase A subunit family amidase